MKRGSTLVHALAPIVAPIEPPRYVIEEFIAIVAAASERRDRDQPRLLHGWKARAAQALHELRDVDRRSPAREERPEQQHER